MKLRFFLAGCVSLILGSLLMADNWLSYGKDPQLTGWSPQETDINRDNVKSMTLLWKAHLENEPRELNSLTAAMVVEWVVTDQGMKEIVIVGGASDHLFAMEAGTCRDIVIRATESATPSSPARSGAPDRRHRLHGTPIWNGEDGGNQNAGFAFVSP